MQQYSQRFDMTSITIAYRWRIMKRLINALNLNNVGYVPLKNVTRVFKRTPPLEEDYQIVRTILLNRVILGVEKLNELPIHQMNKWAKKFILVVLKMQQLLIIDPEIAQQTIEEIRNKIRPTAEQILNELTGLIA
jgi:hypothetical protein